MGRGRADMDDMQVEKLAKLKLQIKQRRGLRVGVELDEPNGEHEGTLAGGGRDAAGLWTCRAAEGGSARRPHVL